MMTPRFPIEDFDRWAKDYDREAVVGRTFPFTGYTQLLRMILRLVNPNSGTAILDLGIGTANLARLFAHKGCEVWGVDFSPAMLAIAGDKLQGARLAQVDIREELPADFQRRFNHIVSAYTFHHFPLDEKVALVKRFTSMHLVPGGRLCIGDIVFTDAAEEERMRTRLGAGWEQEYYWLADESLAAFKAAGMQVVYTRVSSCAGVFLLQN